ncbi:undecaprenyldiphospho-muramoylpentapeptide beta-N-acetylglucosaminyltransferase [Oecophyllibacter saccharovorans]|uniref:undecaprenyldiphospho-muramoylpentapeptide beta-N-acetylglucosaminyltransferase n=1 Tax=Oecophyllibacter saccharovorans TaxID=2558360 RepID=UPI0011718CF4|nr:undecaprenyldiphospho-muramoylpentapeptide beta-N-acetylglucosaminyltransferase [Oecophyllibacter saccharovorans]TPW34868.1 undecaprenyldiphospho-muramoylpentapeptide beta-N-acetylglucosaminyltransferase [Oecophyllibacter saccharovorans]
MSDPVQADTRGPIVIGAGGTGGHFFPAEALAACLIARGHEVVLFTDGRNTRHQDGPFRGRKVHVLAGAGVAGRGLMGKLKGGLTLLRSAFRARRILKDLQPSAVVGFGGYPSIPPLLGARLLPAAIRPPLIIHEGNAVLGQANALLARFATAIATSYPEVARLPENAAVTLTGMPVREGIEALANEGYPAPSSGTPLHLLIWGGSLGASIFSQVMPAALGQLPERLRRRLRVLQQVRKPELEQVRGRYEEAGIQADLHPFITDVPHALAQAHLVIGRAGGSSIAELTMAGRPSLLVPLPIAASDEQGANARALTGRGAAWMLRQPAFTPEAVSQLLNHLLTQPEKLTGAAQAAHRLQHPQAAEKLADLVESLTGPAAPPA